MRSFKLMLLGSALLMHSAFAQSDTKNMTISMTLNPPAASCVISVDNDLQIAGTLPTAGTATFTADPVAGSFSSNGQGTSVDQTASAIGQFTVTVSNSSNATVDVEAPSVLNGTNGSLPFTLRWAKSQGASFYQELSGTSDALTAPGSYVYRVGGDISVDNQAKAGTYSGTINLTVTCN